MHAVLHRFTVSETETMDFLTTEEAGCFRIFPTDEIGIICVDPCQSADLAAEMKHVTTLRDEAPELEPLVYEDIPIVIPKLTRESSVVDMRDWSMQ